MKGIGLSKKTAGKVTRLVREIDDGVQERQGAGAGMFPPTSVAIVHPSIPIATTPGLYRGPVSLLNPDLSFSDFGDVYLYEANEKSLRIDDAYMAIGAGTYNGLPLYVTAMCCDAVEESSSADSTFSCPPLSSSGTSTSTSSGSSLPSGSSSSACVRGDLCFTVGAGTCIPSDIYRLTYNGGNMWSGTGNHWGFIFWMSIDGRYYLQASGPPNIVETPYANYIAPIDINPCFGGTVVLIPGRFSALCLGCSYPFEIALSADCPSSSSSSSCGTLCCSVGGVVGSVTAEVINGNYCITETSPGSNVLTGNNFPGGVPDDCHDGVIQIEVSGSTATMLVQDQGGLVQGHYTCSSWHCGGTFVVNTWAGDPAPTEYPETLTVGAVSGCSECDNTPGCGSSSSSASSSSASSSSSTSSSSASSSSSSSTSSTSSGGSSSAASCPPDCPDCPGGAPYSWTITASGLTAPYESLNGTFELTPDGECQWVAVPAFGTFWLLTTGGELIGGTGSGMFSITFGVSSPQCCSVMTAVYESFEGAEPVPTPGDITVTPGPCCDPSSLASGGGGISGGGEG